MAGAPPRIATTENLHWQPSRFSLATHWLLLLGATAGVFLAGRWEDGNIAAFLGISGVALLLCPPQIRVDGKICAAAFALLLAASLALLPQSWFGALEWRRQLAAAGVPLPASITVALQETLYWLAILALALSTALFALAHPIRSRAQLALGLAIVLICGTYAGLAIYARQSGAELPIASDPAEFGFFRNRNHTSTFLVTGCVVALGILGVASRHRHWFAGTVAAIGLAICIAALIFFSKSRGGIISLLAGTILWFLGLGATHRSRPLLVSFAAVLLGGILLLFSSSGIVSNRLLHLSGSVKERIISTVPETTGTVPLDGRVPIFQDTLQLIRAYPITGVGLGGYRFVFPLYRDRAFWEVPVRHPESDWLMLAAEAGLPAVLAGLAIIALLLRSVWPLRSHPYWPLRWAILCAALSVILHGLVDVPAHRVALGWWMLVLAGFGLQAIPRAPGRPSRWQHAIFLLAGIGALALSIFLFRAQWLGGPGSPPAAASEAEIGIIGLRFDGKMPESLEAAQRAIATFPLADALHFQHGVTLLRLGRKEEADSAFRAQRLLNRTAPRIAVAQGNSWLETDPARTGPLWLEALARRVEIDRRSFGALRESPGMFRDFLAKSADLPALQMQLLQASQIDPAFTFAWLEQAAPALAAAEFANLAADPAFIATLDENGRQRFLHAWYRRGDREPLFTWLAEQPDWQKIARPLALRRLTEAGKFSEAVQTAAEQFGCKLDLAEPGSGDPNAPTVAPEKAGAAFQYYWNLGNVLTARRTLEDARAEPAPGDPEIWRLSAAVSARDGRWDAAWIFLERYLIFTQQASFP